jgi:hypothetical protein
MPYPSPGSFCWYEIVKLNIKYINIIRIIIVIIDLNYYNINNK